MSTIISLAATSKVGDDRPNINTNFANLNLDKIESADTTVGQIQYGNGAGVLTSSALFTFDGLGHALIEENTTSGSNAIPTLHLNQTDSGDVKLLMSVAARDWVLGIDNGTGDRFRIQANDQVIDSDVGLTLRTDGNFGFNSRNPGTTLTVQESTTLTDIGAGININQTSTGDSLLHWSVVANTYTAGIDNSASDEWRLQHGDAVGVGGAGLTLTTANNFAVGKINPASIFHVYENTAGAGTGVGFTLEQDGAGDCVIQYVITGSQRWVAGIDNSDSDKYKIASTQDLVSDARFTISTAGEVGIGLTAPTARLHALVADGENLTAFKVTQNEITNNNEAVSIINAGTGRGILLDQNGNGRAMEIDTEATSVGGLLVLGDGIRTGSSGSSLVFFRQDHASSTGDLLSLHNDGTGKGMFVDQNGDAIAIDIDSEATTAGKYGLRLSRNDASVADTGILVQGNSTAGNHLTVYNNGVFTGTGANALIRFEMDNAGSTGNLLYLQVDGSGKAISIDGGSININNGTGIGTGYMLEDGTTGMYKTGTGHMSFAVEGSEMFRVRTASGGIFHGTTVGAAGLLDDAATISDPGLIANRSDVTTGVGGDGAGSVSLVTQHTTALSFDTNQTATFFGGQNWFRTSTATSVNSAGETVIGVTDNSSARTITLDSSDVVDGRIIIIKDEAGTAGSANTITIATEGSETIDGSATIPISADHGVIRLYSDGTNWFTF